MDFFVPCNFTCIQGYPHDLPEKVDLLPSFQGNNVINVEAHLKAFKVFLGKFASHANYNHGDVSMRLFVLSLEEDALDWFIDFLDNSFDSLQSITNAFNNKYGDKKNKRDLLYAINNMKKDENEILEEFNKRFNDIVRSLSHDYKPPDKFLLLHYLDAFTADISYELRCTKPNDYKVAQTLVEEMENVGNHLTNLKFQELNYKTI